MSGWERTPDYHSARTLPGSSRADGRLGGCSLGRHFRWAPAAPALLLGRLSAVGPAPIDANSINVGDGEARRLRQSVRPGITGWAAINGFPPSESSLPFDIYYVRYRSLGLDLGILLRSLAAPVLVMASADSA